jgi:hypothetical protein
VSVGCFIVSRSPNLDRLRFEQRILERSARCEACPSFVHFMVSTVACRSVGVCALNLEISYTTRVRSHIRALRYGLRFGEEPLVLQLGVTTNDNNVPWTCNGDLDPWTLQARAVGELGRRHSY